MTTSRPPEGGFVAVNGTQLAYDVVGDGPPLVLIHGGYMDRSMWDDQVPVFAESYRVIRYDVRGFGASALPQKPYADRHDLFALLTCLGVEQAALVGLSMGGRIALDFTLEHPEMVEALVLVGTPVGGFPHDLINQTDRERQRVLSVAFDQAEQERNIPAMVEALMAHPTLVPSPQYPAARARVRERLSQWSFAWVLDPAPRQEVDPPAYGRLSEIQVPTLILLGAEDDPLLFQHAKALERGIVGARRVTIAGTHHMPNVEKPEAFNAIVLEFLAGRGNNAGHHTAEA